MSGQLVEGTVFADRYRVVHLLASGGMGAVYKVVDRKTNRKRALKVMHPHLYESEEMRERFLRETRIAADVESEHVVDIFDAGVDEATSMPFLVMELLRGEDLGERRKKIGRFPPLEVVTYLEQTASALDRVHNESIVHRDLKPPNLFLTRRDDGTPRIKVLDFGVAKQVAEGVTSAGLTQSLGTPIYMAPEQFLSNVRLTGAADIFALTMMAYTLLVNQSYWLQESRSADNQLALAVMVMQGVKESAVRRAAEQGLALPPGFDAWFAKGTAMNPADRFRTATDAVRELREVLGIDRAAPMPVLAPWEGRPELQSEPLTPNEIKPTELPQGIEATTPQPVAQSWVWIAVVGAMVVLGVLLGTALWFVLQRPSHRQEAAAQVVSATAAASSAAPVASSAVPVAAAPVVVPASAEPSATVSAAPPTITVVKGAPKPALPVKKSTVRPAPTLSPD